ncbi:MAG: hypothetical protein JWQ40_2900 [Segetibacter sp.]|nr:hypothetical protein [Segetibacter sp.]
MLLSLIESYAFQMPQLHKHFNVGSNNMATTLKNIAASYLTVFMLATCNSVNTETANKVENSQTDTVVAANQNVQVTSTESLSHGKVVFPVDSLMKIKLLTTGNFHSDEVWETADKEKWIGIFKNKEGFYLKQTTVKTRRVHDEIVDENKNEKTGWEVSASNKDSNIILIEALPYLADRKIQTVALSKNFIYPDETLSVSYLGNQYKIFATGSKKKEQQDPEAFEVRNYKLYLTANINGKETTQLLAAQPDFEDKMIELLFAGDIEGDGILDFIIDTSRHYNMISPTIFLSKPADNGQIVKPLGSHVSVGC